MDPLLSLLVGYNPLCLAIGWPDDNTATRPSRTLRYAVVVAVPIDSACSSSFMHGGKSSHHPSIGTASHAFLMSPVESMS